MCFIEDDYPPYIAYSTVTHSLLEGENSKVELKSCIEKNIEPYDVYNADEAFMTATPFCVLPVTRFNGEDIGSGKMGEMTTNLLDKWSSNVGLDIVEQIKSYAKQSNLEAGASPYEFKKK